MTATSLPGWQPRADYILANKGFSHYGLYGHDGTVWAGDKMGGAGTDAEIKTIVVTVAGGRSGDMQINGPKLNGRKYFMDTASDTQAIGHSGNDCFIAQKTGKALILVTYSGDTLSRTNALLVVMKFKDELEKTGY